MKLFNTSLSEIGPVLLKKARTLCLKAWAETDENGILSLMLSARAFTDALAPALICSWSSETLANAFMNYQLLCSTVIAS
ncbi:hypothetical protein CW304_30150 [Bacillus sp. UFRGS-B20]|nr:hypothetical protein CW304_30150 [Bacillus sp. UFRGS-B20]